MLREFDRLHRTYHAWQPSELSTLNETIAAGKEQTVTPEMASLLADAQRLSALGEGLFDPGIGGLIRLWGFQSDEFRAALPDPAALEAWRAERPGIADLHLDGARISSPQRALALDFGGYLKGVALDRAAAILREHGVANALINIGGNVMALGSKNGEPWRIGIQHPRQPGPLATVTLADGEAIGTSGDYQRYFELDGRRYCHLLDPGRGEQRRAGDAHAGAYRADSAASAGRRVAPDHRHAVRCRLQAALRRRYRLAASGAEPGRRAGAARRCRRARAGERRAAPPAGVRRRPAAGSGSFALKRAAAGRARIPLE